MMGVVLTEKEGGRLGGETARAALGASVPSLKGLQPGAEEPELTACKQIKPQHSQSQQQQHTDSVLLTNSNNTQTANPQTANTQTANPQTQYC